MPARTPEDAHRLFVEAFNRQDLEALVDLYEPDAVLCNRRGEPVRGREAIRRAYESMLASKPQMKLQTRYAIQEGELALLRSDWEVSGRRTDGSPLDPRKHGSTEVVRRQSDGSWRYIIDHPFGAD